MNSILAWYLLPESFRAKSRNPVAVLLGDFCEILRLRFASLRMTVFMGACGQ